MPVPNSPEPVRQPLLAVWLSGPKTRLKMRMLVDSGSTETLVPTSITARLGVPLSNERVELVGLGGAKLEAQIAKVDIDFAFGRFKFASRVAVSADLEKQLCVLGYHDFFMSYRVAFYARDGVFTVNEY